MRTSISRAGRASGAVASAALVLVAMAGDARPQECPDAFGASDASDQAQFGQSVDVDGVLAVVGDLSGNGTAPGSAYVVNLATRTELFKVQEPTDPPRSNGAFGWAVAIGEGRAAVGAPGFGGRGVVYVYDVGSGDLLYELEPPDRFDGDGFGSAIDIGDGVIVVGAPNQLADTAPFNATGQAYVFDATNGILLRTLSPDRAAPNRADYGDAVAVGGGRILIGASADQSSRTRRSGAAYVYPVDAGAKASKPMKLIQGSFDEEFGSRFGNAVAIDGDYGVIGSFLDDEKGRDAGAAYVFDLSTGEQLSKLTLDEGAESDLFGLSVAAGGGLAFVYRPRIYVFDLRTGERRSQLPADPLTRDVSDSLGFSMAADDERLLAGAPQNDARGFQAGEVEIFVLDELPNTPIVLEPEPEVSTIRFEIDIPGFGIYVFESRIVGRIVAEAPLDCEPPKSFQITQANLRPDEPVEPFSPAPNVTFTVHEPALVLVEPSPVAEVQPDGSVTLDVEVMVTGTFEYQSPFGDGLIDLADTGTIPFTLTGNVDNSGGPVSFGASIPPTEQEIETGSAAGNPVYTVSGNITAKRISLDYVVPIPSKTQKAAVTLEFARDGRDKTSFAGFFAPSDAPDLGDGVTGVLRVGAARFDVPLSSKGKSAKGLPVKMRIKTKKKKATFRVAIKKSNLRAAYAALPALASLPRDIPWTFTLPDGWRIGGVLEMDGKDKLKIKNDALVRAKLKMLKRK